MTRLLRIFIVFSFLLVGWPLLASAQQKIYTIKGRVTDKATGEGIPFVSIAPKGTTSGTMSDVDGRYSLQIRQLVDSLVVLSLGYRTGSYPILPQTTQTINAQLT